VTFTVTYVGPEAHSLLGFPSDWWKAPDFWHTRIVHPDDADDALSHCAIATAAGLNHDFGYRARARDGAVLHLHDIVHVIKGPLGFAHRLRGLMLPIASDA
jgi:hypothetical protein